MSDNDGWLYPGATVGVTSRHSFAIRTVKTIGRRFVVLDDGSRFDKVRLSKSVDSWTVEHIRRPDDPEVLRLRADRDRRAAVTKAQKALDKWRASFNPITQREAAASLVAIVSAYLGGTA